jgi:hypothetical protein
MGLVECDLKPEIVVIGFPKCGTSALIRRLEDDAEVTVLRPPSGGLEMTWPLIKDLPPTTDQRGIVAHKFTAYIYNLAALDYLARSNPDSIAVVCFRNPLRALVSWHNMHRNIALSGNPPNHFAAKEREFYSDCSIEEYFEKFAQSRLQYDKFLSQALSVFSSERLVVVSQERLAYDMPFVVSSLKAIAENGPVPVAKKVSAKNRKKHVGYADMATADISDSVHDELTDVHNRLMEIINHDIVFKYT